MHRGYCGTLHFLEAPAEKRGRKDDETELEVLINLELSLKRKAEKTLDAYEDDDIDRDTFRERMAVVREKQADIARSKAEVTARLVKWAQGPGGEERIKELVELAQIGLPNFTFEDKRRFLEGMDIQMRLDGNKLTIKGLITDNTTLILTSRRSTATDTTPESVLCEATLGWPLCYSVCSRDVMA